MQVETGMKRPRSVPGAGHLIFSQQGLQGPVGGLGHTMENAPRAGAWPACFVFQPMPSSLHPGDAQQRALASRLELQGSSVLLFATLGGHRLCARPSAGMSLVCLLSLSQHPHLAGEETEAHRG